MILVEEATSSDQDENNSNINSILNPAGPRLASQKRERSLVVLIITLIGLSIVIAATVGGVLGSRNNEKDNDGGGGGVVEKSEAPAISPMTSFAPSSSSLIPTSSPINSGVVPPTPTPSTNSSTTSPSFSPTLSICYNVDIIIIHDMYPGDTSWTIEQVEPPLPPNDTIVEFSPRNDTNQSRTVCLTRGLYNFTIFDDYPDGLCCEWGIGNYTLVYQGIEGGDEDEEEKVIASGGEFIASESTVFSIPYVDLNALRGRNEDEQESIVQERPLLYPKSRLP
ncbi:hypothetical protein QTG54_015729 [Skeletonema marinoi]|uniref:Uncharacterized protein n=1 Tax=Skeletonema marinoi TaxID=267567 RepID=A0AAD9D4D6_9STRA|nr:hypothetical protein QTG54_015729 [Skeletonema marinoi]